MEDDQITESAFCRHCGRNDSEVMAEAEALGFQDEFRDGLYSCCEIVQWAGEQWRAWLDAAKEDAQNGREAKRPERGDLEELFLPVRARRHDDQSSK